MLVARISVRRFSLVRQAHGGERNTDEANAEFLQRPAPRDGLGQTFGQLIEFVVHNFPFVLGLPFVLGSPLKVYSRRYQPVKSPAIIRGDGVGELVGAAAAHDEIG